MMRGSLLFCLFTGFLVPGCVGGDGPVDPSAGASLSISLSPPASGLAAVGWQPVDRVRLVASDAAGGDALETLLAAVDPALDAWEVDFEIPVAAARSVVVTIELLATGEAGNEVEWSGRAGPFTVGAVRRIVVPGVELHRGPLSNLDITEVRIGRPVPVLREGATAELSVAVEGASGPPVVFWHSLDPAVADVSAEGVVQAHRAGLAGIVAAAGPRADTVQVEVGSPDEPDFEEGIIAFVSDRTGVRQIFRMNSDGSEPTQLTTGGLDKNSPAWDPTGSAIAYSSNNVIWRMGANGEAPTPLNGAELSRTGVPAWSPDGSEIAVQATQPDEVPWNIYILDAGGEGMLRRVTTSEVSLFSPDWSPDGESIVISEGSHNGTVTVIDRITGEPRATFGAGRNPRWSPDGSRIAYALNSAIEVADVETGDTFEIPFSGSPWDIAWSPDGHFILFSDLVTFGVMDLYVVRSNGADAPIRITDLPNSHDADGSWTRP